MGSFLGERKCGLTWGKMGKVLPCGDTGDKSGGIGEHGEGRRGTPKANEDYAELQTPD